MDAKMLASSVECGDYSSIQHRAWHWNPSTASRSSRLVFMPAWYDELSKAIPKEWPTYMSAS
jgi:hypothetical protein